jgi:membrane protein YdbS with pleckstrin-like domain
MMNRLSAWLLHVLRVPTEPCVPYGAREIRTFRASPRYFLYKLLLWVLVQLGTATGLVIGFVVLSIAMRNVSNGLVFSLFRWGEIFAWSTFVLLLPVRFAILRLGYEMHWYILSDRALRIRRGVVSLREKTMTYANIQQIAIRQNPLQRLFGISDVQVRSAGGGGGEGEESGLGESLHEAWFRGVENGDEIVAALRQRVRIHRDSGLGDVDESPVPTAPPAAVFDAADELRRETHLLRRALAANAQTPHPG